MHNKKSQLYSQIFIYILAILITSFIVVFGYKAIRDFKDRAEQVACLKLRNDLQSAIERMSSEYGSIERKDIQLCNNYRAVCFVDDLPSGQLVFSYVDYITNPAIKDPIILDSISSGAGKNVFLVENIAKESFYAGKISVEGDVLCIKAINNKISLRLEGRGDHTLVSKWA